jgi:phosphomevalonate kinase
MICLEQASKAQSTIIIDFAKRFGTIFALLYRSEALKHCFHGCRHYMKQLLSLGKEGKVLKTGMGSSATLTTSLVGCILQFFGIVDLRLSSDYDLMIVHNLSQIAHSISQGKIGSGFDVSAAVYGTLHTVIVNNLDNPYFVFRITNLYTV